MLADRLAATFRTKERVFVMSRYKKPTLWTVAVVAILVAICFLLWANNDLVELRSQYPAFFGLDSKKGLDVYVWQMAEGSYDFGLLPHSDEPRNWLSSELMELPGANAEQMQTILSTYDLDEVDIYIIPWQNPLSSYIADPWLITEGESQEEKLENYIASIKALLFVDSPSE